MNYISVAIDGPAGAGKSSVSKAVAKALGYVYIDTGAMYRAVALYAIRNGIISDTQKIIDALDDIKIEIKYSDIGQLILLNGEDVTLDIRQEEVSKGASAVAVIGEVRKKLVKMQQEMARHDNVIMDGRDICSVVLPDAQVKIFLTASADARAQRRYKELLDKGVECNLETIKEDIIARDYNDSHRSESPLVKTDDAVLVDTSDCDFDESVRRIQEIITKTVG